jgi:hypothetical protein
MENGQRPNRLERKFFTYFFSALTTEHFEEKGREKKYPFLSLIVEKNGHNFGLN